MGKQTSSARHGADDFDDVAIMYRGRRPSGAPHHGAVKRDGKAARLADFEVRGFNAPEFGEIFRRAIAFLAVDGELHAGNPSRTPLPGIRASTPVFDGLCGERAGEGASPRV